MESTVKQSIEALRKTLDESTASPELQGDMNMILDQLRTAAEQGEQHGLRERLDKALILFDDDHPDIALAIRAVIQALTQSGI